MVQDLESGSSIFRSAQHVVQNAFEACQDLASTTYVNDKENGYYLYALTLSA